MQQKFCNRLSNIKVLVKATKVLYADLIYLLFVNSGVSLRRRALKGVKTLARLNYIDTKWTHC